MQACNIGTSDVGRIESANRISGHYCRGLEQEKGIIVGNDRDGDDSVINALVPLNNMFGYSTALRSMTQGKGEFSVEYKEQFPVSPDVQAQLINVHKPETAE